MSRFAKIRRRFRFLSDDRVGSMIHVTINALVQRETDFCLIGVNRKWVSFTDLF